MARTVVGIFDNETEAQDALQHLQKEGISRSSIDLTLPNQSGNHNYEHTDTAQHRSGITQDQSWSKNEDVSNRNQENNPDFNRTSSSSNIGMNQNSDATTNSNFSDRDRTTNQDGGNIFNRIGNFFSSLFDNDEDANRYTQASQSRSIVTVHTQSMDEAERAADIMDECGAIDTDNQTNYDHATGNMGRGSSFEENIGNAGSRSRTSGSSRRSRIFERPVESQNRLSSDYFNEGPMDNDAFNQKPII